MKETKDYSEFIISIIAFIFIGFILFLIFNGVNECKDKDGVLIQGRCVKREVLVDGK